METISDGELVPIHVVTISDGALLGFQEQLLLLCATIFPQSPDDRPRFPFLFNVDEPLTNSHPSLSLSDYYLKRS